MMPPNVTPRQLRALVALIAGPVMREQLDRVAGCSNSPQLVRGLIGKGIEIECTEVRTLDRDGRACRPGRYSLTEAGRKSALLAVGGGGGGDGR